MLSRIRGSITSATRALLGEQEYFVQLLESSFWVLLRPCISYAGPSKGARASTVVEGFEPWTYTNREKASQSPGSVGNEGSLYIDCRSGPDCLAKQIVPAGVSDGKAVGTGRRAVVFSLVRGIPTDALCTRETLPFTVPCDSEE